MFKRDIWCLGWCSAFKPSPLNKINCGDAGLAICSVTVGGGRGGGMHPTASIGPHEISGSRDWIPLWFYWESGEESERVLVQYSDCHLSSTSRWDCFSSRPGNHWWIFQNIQQALRLSLRISLPGRRTDSGTSWSRPPHCTVHLLCQLD